MGKHGSIAVTERVIRTLKYEWLRRVIAGPQAVLRRSDRHTREHCTGRANSSRPSLQGRCLGTGLHNRVLTSPTERPSPPEVGLVLPGQTGSQERRSERPYAALTADDLR